MKIIGQTNFWTGIADDIRSTLPNSVYYCENVECGKNKSLKQVVNNQAENALGYSVDYCITKLAMLGGTIYGLGQDGNTNKDTMLFYKTSDLSSNWAGLTGGTTSGTTFRQGNSLLALTAGTIYFDPGSDYVASYNIGTKTTNATWKAITGGLKGGITWQGNIYGWNGQDIYQIDPVANTLTNMKTVSSEQTMVDLVPYGNLLMVICTSTITNSKAYLWDGVNTTTWVDILDLGYGTVSGADTLDGIVCVVIGSTNKRSFKIKAYNGGIFQNVYTYTARSNRAGTYNYVLPASRVKAYSGFIYFIITGTKPDGTYAGFYEYAIARYGREDPNTPMAFSIYKTIDFTSARGLDGQTTNNDLLILENIVGASNTQEKSVLAFINSDTNKTTGFISSTTTYTAQPGVVETAKQNGGDSSVNKQLKSVSAFYSALGGSGQVVMDYKKDEEKTWTTIFTDSTDNSISHESHIIESTVTNLPQFKEIQLRFQLTGGAELTGWKAKYEELNQDF